MSCEFSTSSEASSEPPSSSTFCTRSARASASARAARARASSALMSPSCCVERLPLRRCPEPVSLPSTLKSPWLGAVVGDRLLGIRHAPAQPLDLLLQPFGRGDRRLPLGVLLQLDEGVGDGVRDLRRKHRIGRGELDADHPRLLQRKDRQPLEIALHHPLADGGIGRAAAEPDRDQQRADERRLAAPDRIPAGA